MISSKNEIELSKSIEYLRLELYGSGYDISLDEKIKAEFAVYGIRSIVRGQKGPAADPDLVLQILLQIYPYVSDAIISGLIKFVLSNLGKAIYKKAKTIYGNEKKKINVSELTVTTEKCDICILFNHEVSPSIDEIDLNALFSQIKELIDNESDNGRYINKIIVPAGLKNDSSWLSLDSNKGNYSLWEIEYRQGEYWPRVVYDAINEAFIVLEDRKEIIKKLYSEDKFLIK